MINYRPISGLSVYQPAFRQEPILAGPQMGQLSSIGPVPSLLGTAVGAGTAWVGWTVGREKSGFLSVAGYIVAVVGALGAVGGAIGLIGSLGR
jgi:hypothetical protein